VQRVGAKPSEANGVCY